MACGIRKVLAAVKLIFPVEVIPVIPVIKPDVETSQLVESIETVSVPPTPNVTLPLAVRLLKLAWPFKSTLQSLLVTIKSLVPVLTVKAPLLVVRVLSGSAP